MPKQNTIPTLYIGQAAHNDWDWVSTFEQFYNGKSPFIYSYNVQDCFDVVFKSFQLLTEASTNITTMPGAITKDGFIYNICEIAFLRSYFADNQVLFTKIEESVTNNLHIVGGGITSPSSILAYGEAAIRNYLLGNNWMRKNLSGYRDTDSNKKVLKTIWLPDSFGIDPNIPVLIQALGLTGFGNSRFGGNPKAYDALGATYVSDANSKISPSPFTKSKATYVAEKASPISELLTTNGPTFRMIASDQSETIAHFMFSGYNALSTGKTHKDNAGMTFTDYKIDNIYFGRLRDATPKVDESAYSGVNALQAAWDAQFNADPTKGTQQYMHVSDDMMWPCVVMEDFINTFNTQNEGKVKAVQGSFDEFIEAVSTEKEKLHALQNFQTTPYMDGYYSSCPDLKAGHLAATHTLVAAEAFVVLLSTHIDPKTVDGYLKNIHQAWQNLVPSTHHAYVTGLSTREVYTNEQRPYLFYPDTEKHTFGDKLVTVPGGKGALPLGKEVLETVMTTIASLLTPNTTTASKNVAVFNPVGLSQERLVEVDIATSSTFLSTDFMSTRGNSVQLVHTKNEKGEASSKALFFANPSSFGYQSVQLSAKDATPIANPMTVDFAADGTSATINNGDLVVVLGKNQKDIAITSMKYQGKEVVKDAGNTLHFYEDSGSSFQFGYEKGGTNSFHTTNTGLQFKNAVIQAKTAILGPLKVEIETTSVYTYKNQDFTYSRIYTFIAEESFVRMKTKGKAPDNYSVFVDFPLHTDQAKGYDQMVYGTPNHWTQQPTQPDWKPYGDWDGPYMKGSWHFAMGIDAAKNTSAAIYHKGVPGWGFYNNNTNIVGCLFRAVPVANNLWPWKPMPDGGADLTIVDQEAHTLEYAFRVPGVQLPDQIGSAHPMFEAMAYQNDLIGIVATPKKTTQTLAPNGQAATLEKIDGHTMGVLSAVRVSSPAIERGQKGANSLITRIYQPWNKQQDLSLSIDASYTKAQEVSALETVIKTDQTISKPEVDPKTKTSIWKISATHALTTLKIDN